jgi:hypothetical protein
MVVPITVLKSSVFSEQPCSSSSNSGCTVAGLCTFFPSIAWGCLCKWIVMSVLYVKMEHYKNKKLLKQYSCTNTIRIYCVFIYWHPQAILGKKVQRPATVQPELLEELQGCSEKTDDFKTVIGTTMCIFVLVMFHFYIQYRHYNSFTQQDIRHTILAFSDLDIYIYTLN